MGNETITMKQFIQYNLIAFAAVFISRYIIIPFDHYNIAVANYLWLPMGAGILAIVLFGNRAAFGVLAGYLVAAFIIKGGFDMAYINSYLGKVIDTIAPIVAIWIMKQMNVKDYFAGGRLLYLRMLPLILITVLLANGAKLIVYPMNGKIISDWVWFFQSYSLSATLGSIVFIVVTLTIFRPMLVRHNII